MTKPQVQKKNEEIEPETWSMKGFLHEVKRIHKSMEDRRFAFILGAGASIESKIKGAAALANEWMEIVFHRLHNSPDDKYEDWLKSNPLNLDNWDPEDLAKHYPQIFEQCFAGDHDSGYAALEDAITGRKPSLGYAVLAWILSSTNHKMVITTNFDNLVADAVSIYGGTSPHVIGHESLAHYAKPLPRRPIVAKIHRDLLTSPINTCEGTSELEDQWRMALKNIFRFYTPVFIGYGGNDGSLMSFLESLDINDISGRPFWCHYAPDGAPNSAINKLMKKHNGVLVPSAGFDEFMLQVGEAVGFERHKQIAEIKKNSEQLINQLQEQMRTLNEETQDVGVKKILKPQENEKQNWGWLDWQLHIDEESNIAKQDKLYLEAINSLPDSYQLHGNYAIFLKKHGYQDKAEPHYLQAIELEPNDATCLGNYANFLNAKDRREDAEQYYRRAIKADPNHSTSLGNYANFLSEQREREDAEQYYRRAIKADPNHSSNLGNYANFLTDQGKLDEAEHYYRRAIEATPNHANNLGNYALLLEKKGKLDEAEQYYRRAIEADPTHANNLGNYAILLKAQGHLENAKQYYRRAIEIEPNDANFLGNYAILLSEQGKLEEAEQYYHLAIEATPNHANNLGNYANFLTDQGKLDEAEQYYRRAIEANPNHGSNLGNYAIFLYEQRKYEEADQYFLQAIEFQPNDVDYLGNYATCLKKQGKTDEADKNYLRAIEIAPNHTNNLGNYALFLKEQEKLKEANKVIQQALAIAPNDEHLLEIRASIESKFPHLEETA